MLAFSAKTTGHEFRLNVTLENVTDRSTVAGIPTENNIENFIQEIISKSYKCTVGHILVSYLTSLYRSLPPSPEVWGEFVKRRYPGQVTRGTPRQD